MSFEYVLHSKCVCDLCGVILVLCCSRDCPAVMVHENEAAPRKKKTRKKESELIERYFCATN